MSEHLVSELMGEVEHLIEDVAREPAALRLLEGRASIEEYAAFLEQTYHYVCWTRPLLARAGARLAAQGRAPGLAALLTQKAGEEDGHERWALDDLAALGRDADAIRAARPGAAAEAYIAWNRYCVEEGAPEAFLGTAFILEALSARYAGEAAERLAARSGIPGIEGAVRFLRGHADADGEHTAELAALLRAVGDAEARAAISLSARVTRALYPRLMAPAR